MCLGNKVTGHGIVIRVQRSESGEGGDGDAPRVEVGVDANFALNESFGLVVEVRVDRAGVAELGGAAGASRRELVGDETGQADSSSIIRLLSALKSSVTYGVDMEQPRLLSQEPPELSWLDDTPIQIEIAGIAQLGSGEPPALPAVRHLPEPLPQRHKVRVGQARVAEDDNAVLGDARLDLVDDSVREGKRSEVDPSALGTVSFMKRNPFKLGVGGECRCLV